MKSKCILDEFEELSLKKNITKEELMIFLKNMHQQYPYMT